MCCPRDQLCQRCYTQALENLCGVARARGMMWADRIARRGIDRRRPWPTTPRATAIARRLVGGLVQDQRLEAELAGECAAEAARWWNRSAAS